MVETAGAEAMTEMRGASHAWELVAFLQQTLYMSSRLVSYTPEVHHSKQASCLAQSGAAGCAE